MKLIAVIYGHDFRLNLSIREKRENHFEKKKAF